MPKRLLILLLCTVYGFSSLAQGAKKSGIVKGKLINSITKTPFNDVKVTLLSLNVTVTSEGGGEFIFNDIPYGSYAVVTGGSIAKRDTLNIEVSKDVTDMGEIMVAPNEKGENSEGNEIPTIAVEETAGQDEENASATSESSAGFYNGNQDPFLKVASITFGSYRFKPRGYDNADVQINGMPLQDLETGFSSLGQVGGLNDVLRDRQYTYGLRPSEFTFGTVKGSTQINATAADQRRGTTLSYFASNRTFTNRVMATYNTGVMKNGWAFSVSGSRRWAQEGYVEGTFYNGYSYYAAASKLTKTGQFNLTVIGAPTVTGRAGVAQDEAFDLAGSHYYNRNWGYQNGEKRNARVFNVNQPVFIANYTYKPTATLRWNTTLGYEFGKFKRSDIDFYNANNPYPDYYRALPSYFINGDNTPNAAAAAGVRANLLANPGLMQLQWDNFYQANYSNKETVFNANGIAGNNVTGNRSLYVLRNEVDDNRKMVFNSNVEKVLNSHLNAYGGLQAIHQRDEYYKELLDLLGGDFFVNQNQFAVQTAVNNSSYNQNNLEKPNQVVKVGDRYGYDYIMRILNTNIWGQVTGAYNKIGFFVAANGGMVSFSREGLVRNGLFPENSFGKSATQKFMTYKGKGGVTYNINLKNSVFLNAAYMTDAPRPDYVFVSQRSRDILVNNPQTVKTMTTEFGYMLKSSGFNFRISGYVTDIKDNTLNKRFFNDDPAFNTFINYVMQGVNTRSIGTEMYATYKVNKSLTVTAVAAIGQSFYTNRPAVSVYYDNDPNKAAVTRNVYIKNYYLGVGPQSIYSLAFAYSPRKWRLNLNLNYMDRNYVEINPDRRTQQAADRVEAGSAQWRKIYDQERLPSAFTVDISGGRNFDVSDWMKSLHHKTTLNFNAGISNLLNNQDIKMTGFEQLRYDFKYYNADKFPNKYSYAYGMNFYATLSLRF
ncbi:MAG: hypothetical protein H7257_14390 [Taibaiella sp.]|nr:hypothetical protein [Taibaiella sp.]